MRRLIDEHLWFLVNAALVAGLVALGSALSAREGGEPTPAASSIRTEAQVQAPAAPQVTVGAMSSTSIEQAPPPAPVRTAPAPRPTRPRIIGGELEDDD